MKNTLFLGNGFARCLKNQKSWSSLLQTEESTSREEDSLNHLYTFLYEQSLMTRTGGCSSETKDCPERITEKKCEAGIRCEKGFKEQIRSQLLVADEEFGEDGFPERFEQFLMEMEIHDIITTNFDCLIERLMEKCGYELDKDKSTLSEKIYSIRRQYTYQKADREIRIWKIHGDVGKVETIMLGLDQYCGSIGKLDGYIKGKYELDHKKVKPMLEKCRTEEFDDLSWVEHFFHSNLFIVGFGMDFSEIDLWWILNKRARFILQNPKEKSIQNTITYYTNDKREDIAKVLTSFQVEVRSLDFLFKENQPNPEYLQLVFDEIRKRKSEETKEEE